MGLLVALAAVVFAIFASLGTWQIARLSWKLDLIARVNERVHAKEVDAPGSSQWLQLNASNDEYRRIHLAGSFIAGQDTLVQAVTERGSGFWVITPLRLADGTVVMVNRGFIPLEATRNIASAITNTNNESNVTGFLRMTQPGGAFLHQNDPVNHRWYSRDVQAIAKASGLSHVAPYFLDADATSTQSIAPSANNVPFIPVGGLTVIVFHNNHLVYALTWYALAAMVAGAAWHFFSAERRLRHDKKAEVPDRVADN